MCLQYQSLVGSLNWLAHTTHPDLSTIVSLLAQHQSTPSSGHSASMINNLNWKNYEKHQN
jgi:hypothetical protein